MATRGSYVHNSMVEYYRGHPDNISFMQFSQKMYGFRQKESQGFYFHEVRALRTLYEFYLQLYIKQDPLEKF